MKKELVLLFAFGLSMMAAAKSNAATGFTASGLLTCKVGDAKQRCTIWFNWKSEPELAGRIAVYIREAGGSVPKLFALRDNGTDDTMYTDVSYNYGQGEGLELYLLPVGAPAPPTLGLLPGSVLLSFLQVVAVISPDLPQTEKSIEVRTTTVDSQLFAAANGFKPLHCDGRPITPADPVKAGDCAILFIPGNQGAVNPTTWIPVEP